MPMSIAMHLFACRCYNAAGLKSLAIQDYWNANEHLAVMVVSVKESGMPTSMYLPLRHFDINVANHKSLTRVFGKTLQCLMLGTFGLNGHQRTLRTVATVMRAHLCASVHETWSCETCPNEFHRVGHGNVGVRSTAPVRVSAVTHLLIWN